MNRYLESLMGSNLAVLLRGVRFGVRDAYRSGRASFAAADPSENRQLRAIPTKTLDDILGTNEAVIKLRVVKYEDGMMPRRDAVALLSIAVVENPAQVVEIGTYMGHTTRAMAENLPEAIIHTVDLPPDFSVEVESNSDLAKDDFHLIARRKVGREFRNHACESRIKQHFGDTATFDFSTLGNPTLFFIDGSHTYDYCKNDTERCLELSGGRGTFLWHDCDQSHPGVVRCLEELIKTGKEVVRIDGTSLGYWKGG